MCTDKCLYPTSNLLQSNAAFDEYTTISTHQIEGKQSSTIAGKDKTQHQDNKTTIKANDETFMLHTKSVIINLVVYRYENNPKHHKYIHTWSKPYTNTVTLFPHMHGRRINSQCFISSTHTNFHSIVAAILAVIIPPSRYNLLFHSLCSLLLLVLHSFINC